MVVWLRIGAGLLESAFITVTDLWRQQRSSGKSEWSAKIADDPVIQGILEYLSSGKEFEDNSWAHTIDTNNNYPHADWWHYPYASWWEDTPANRFATDYNPTAGLAGFILYFEDPDTDFYDLAKEVATEAINQFLMIKDCKEMYVVACFTTSFKRFSNASIGNSASNPASAI